MQCQVSSQLFNHIVNGVKIMHVIYAQATITRYVGRVCTQVPYTSVRALLTRALPISALLTVEAGGCVKGLMHSEYSKS